MAHRFKSEKKSGLATRSEYILIYCEKCGFVSYDQSQSKEQRVVPPCVDEEKNPQP